MEFLTYKKFNERESAEELTSLLDSHAIEFEVAEERDSLDSLYGDKHFSKQFVVKIRSDDFEKVDSILQQESEKELGTVGKDHYLYGFTDEELFEILSKPDEWSAFDYQLSKKILQERGREINADTIDLLKKKRIMELAKPEEHQTAWVVGGYIFALLGGLLGIFIGWHLSSHKKTLPNGQRVFGYTETDRKSGKRILIIGILMFIFWTTLRISTTDF